MDDNEGSVVTEDSDDAEESQDTESSTEDAGTTDQTSEQATEAQTAEAEAGDSSKQDVSEKGTKLDDNPLSRVNQELANERAKVRQYEGVLNDPTVLKKYVQTFDKTEEEPEIKYEDVQTNEDLQKFLKQRDSKVEGKIKDLDQTISNIKSAQKDTITANRIQSDITAIRSQWDELDPKFGQDGKPTNPNYDPVLDNSIGRIYEMYDLDKQTGGFKGQVSIKDIAEIVMQAAGSSKKQGSAEAQTTIINRKSGRAVSGASNAAPDETNMTPGQLIASRIKAARGGR
jgi:hypothetical protein